MNKDRPFKIDDITSFLPNEYSVMKWYQNSSIVIRVAIVLTIFNLIATFSNIYFLIYR